MDSTLFKPVVASIALITIFTTQVLSLIIEAQYIQSMSYNILYDPLDNTGILTLNSTIYTSYIGDCSYIEIPVGVIGDVDTVYTFINYTTSPGLYLLGSGFNEYSRVFEAIACGYGVIELTFTLDNALDEDGLFQYVGLIDTSSLYQYTGKLELNITLIDQYNITVYNSKGNLYIIVDSNTNSIYAKGFGSAYIVLRAEIQEVNTTTPTQTTTKITTTPTTTLTQTEITRTYTWASAETTPSTTQITTTQTSQGSITTSEIQTHTYPSSGTSSATQVSTTTTTPEKSTRVTTSSPEVATETVTRHVTSGSPEAISERVTRLKPGEGSVLIIVGLSALVVLTVLTWLLYRRRYTWRGSCGVVKNYVLILD
jgi:hypothetical protein